MSVSSRISGIVLAALLLAAGSGWAETSPEGAPSEPPTAVADTVDRVQALIANVLDSAEKLRARAATARAQANAETDPDRQGEFDMVALALTERAEALEAQATELAALLEALRVP